MTPAEMKIARVNLGNITQEELAEKLGLSRQMVGLMETGKAPIEPRTEMSILYLLSKKEFKND